MGRPRNTPETFWARVNKNPGFGPHGHCWRWLGRLNEKGYGQFSMGNRNRLAHSFAYEFTIEPVPQDLELDHLCRNRSCVNPAHLEPVTNTENCRRGVSVAVKRVVSFCPSGHPYDEQNTYWSKTRSRHCRTCTRERMTRLRWAKYPGPDRRFARNRAPLTHCRHGHAYDEQNTYVNKLGSRVCRTCWRKRRPRM